MKPFFGRCTVDPINCAVDFGWSFFFFGARGFFRVKFPELLPASFGYFQNSCSLNFCRILFRLFFRDDIFSNHSLIHQTRVDGFDLSAFLRD